MMLKDNSNQTYITDSEREKCRKVASVYAELENYDIIVLDVGRYGFVKLQYYSFPGGFDEMETFTDSQKLSDDLWNEWLHTQIIILAEEMGIGDIDYDDVFKRLPEEKQKEIMSMRNFFEKQIAE